MMSRHRLFTTSVMHAGILPSPRQQLIPRIYHFSYFNNLSIELKSIRSSSLFDYKKCSRNSAYFCATLINNNDELENDMDSSTRSNLPSDSTISLRDRSTNNAGKRNAAENNSEFLKPLTTVYPRLPCRICGDSRRISCQPCKGKGYLNRGGYNKRNPVSLQYILGSKWTAMEKTFGWTHYVVESKRKNGKEWFLEMVATCDETTRFWVNAKNLKDRERWSMGWLQRKEMESYRNIDNNLAQGIACKACKGSGMVECKHCKEDEDKNDDNNNNGGRLDMIFV